MKRLEISKLMDEYQDNEFFPEGRSTADMAAVKNMILEKAGPTKKRRVPRFGQALLAAALAGALILTATATVLSGRVYKMLGGNAAYVDDEVAHMGMATNCPVKKIDGRIYIEDNGKTIDITGLFDEETPYIYTRTDPNTGETGYLAVGGTPEDFGWAEIYKAGSVTLCSYDNADYSYSYVDGEWITDDQLTKEQVEYLNSLEGAEERASYKTIDRPWFAAVRNRFGIH